MPDEDKTSGGSLGLDLRILMTSRAHTLVREVLTHTKKQSTYLIFSYVSHCTFLPSKNFVLVAEAEKRVHCIAMATLP